MRGMRLAMICTVLAIAIAPPGSLDLVSFRGFPHKSPSLNLVEGCHTSNLWIPGSWVPVDVILVGSGFNALWPGMEGMVANHRSMVGRHFRLDALHQSFRIPDKK